MKKFIKIFTNKSSAGIEEAINEFAQNKSVEIVSATTFVNQGMFYATVIFEKAKVKAKEDAKNE
jgi:hypothetical protein